MDSFVLISDSSVFISYVIKFEDKVIIKIHSFIINKFKKQ